MAKIKFPDGFLWGAGTSSYQIEGAWNKDGKGASIWDTFTHAQGNIKNNETGDIACDHYFRFKDDVQLMKELGLKTYRFSISWPRIFPKGNFELNKEGIIFYDRLVDELLKNGIEPMITLYHWDMPQDLMDRGGLLSRDFIPAYEAYADYLFDYFGSRVKKWITFNEPWVFTFCSYKKGNFPPRMKGIQNGIDSTHITNLAHAAAVRKFRGKNIKNGIIGTAQCAFHFEPEENTASCVEKTRYADLYQNKWYWDPAMLGEYPQEMIEYFKEVHNAGLKLIPGDIELIKDGISDFFGANYYFRLMVRDNGSNMPFKDEECIYMNPNPPHTEMNWEVNPQALYTMLMRVKKDYNCDIYITENGIACKDEVIKQGIIQDDERISYISSHLEELHRAINDGAKVKGYYAWSLMDNFEWAHGYGKKFGLIKTDYKTQKRTVKKSGYFYKDVIENNGF